MPRATHRLGSVRFVAIICGLLAAGGCVTTDQHGDAATHIVVIGFGIITVPKPNEANDIIATRISGIGLIASGQPGLKFGLGYTSSSLVAIPKSVQNALVEVGTCTENGMKIRTSLPQQVENQDETGDGS